MNGYINTENLQKEQTNRYLTDKVLFIPFRDLIPHIEEEALRWHKSGVIALKPFLYK